MSKTNKTVLGFSEAGAGEQTAFQSTGKEARQTDDSQEKTIVDKKSGIKKVNVEIVDEKMIALKKEKEAKTHELSLKSLDACVDGIRKAVYSISESFCRIGFFFGRLGKKVSIKKEVVIEIVLTGISMSLVIWLWVLVRALLEII